MQVPCFKDNRNSIIGINHNLQKLKTQARENLVSEVENVIY